MKLSFLSPIALFMFFGNLSAKNYYVSTSGSNTNAGTSLTATWKTIAYASSSSLLAAGDTVFVKAGNYGAENVSFSKSGVTTKPIVFMGYQTTPGDAPNLNFKIGNSLNASIMPLLDGGNRASGKVGVQFLGCSYVVFKNFQITNYTFGVNTGNSFYLTLDNVIVMSIGDVALEYSGKGLQVGTVQGSISSYNNILNCIVVNSAAEGLTVNGNNNYVSNCQVYCNEGLTGYAATDYYLIVVGNNNTITDCYTNRIGDLAHYGHGIGLKYNCTNNKFIHCTSRNMSEDFYVRHRGVVSNVFTNCVGITGSGFVVRDGAGKNIFEGCVADSVKAGFKFLDTSEDGGAQYAGRNNVFRNCIVKNAYIAVHFDEYDQISLADSNTMSNCVFDKIDYLFYCGKENKNNDMINCIVTNAKNLKAGTNALACNFNYDNFYSNSFTKPAGTGNIAVNPLYVNAATQDFHIQSTSPCKDAGITLSNNSVDYEGTARPQGTSFDMGAFEYKQATSSTLKASSSSMNVSCLGGSNGRASISPIGGREPYKYTWSNGSTTATITGLKAGSYSATITDIQSASANVSVTISQPTVALTSAIASQAHVSCNGGNNGSAVINGVGGTPGYQYLWSPSNQTTSSATGLSAMNYTVTLTDAKGCSTQKTVTPTQPSVMAADVVSTKNVSCNGKSDASASVSPSGGVGSYSYWWMPSAKTTAGVSGLNATNHTVTVTDGNGCKVQKIVAITQPALLSVNNANIKNVSNCQASDGSISVLAQGGTANYSYLWNTFPVQTTSAATNLPTGAYNVTVTDANGCTATSSADVTCSISTSVANLNVIAVNVYPNPTADVVTIEASDLQSVVIRSVNGNEVYAQATIHADRISVNMSQLQLTQSLYFATITTAHHTAVKQIAYVK
jgi:hypothetical protein